VKTQEELKIVRRAMRACCTNTAEKCPDVALDELVASGGMCGNCERIAREFLLSVPMGKLAPRGGKAEEQRAG